MKTIKHYKLTDPNGNGDADYHLEVTARGITQHRLVCGKCENEKAFELTTPEEDCKIVLDWLSEHVHIDR